MQPYEMCKANHVILNLQMRKTKLGKVNGLYKLIQLKVGKHKKHKNSSDSAQHPQYHTTLPNIIPKFFKLINFRTVCSFYMTSIYHKTNFQIAV